MNRVALVGILILAASLRLAVLGRDELWFDEAYAGLVAMEPAGRVIEELERDSSPPLYYLALRAWTLIFGPSPFALRALSVASGILAVFLAGLLGARLASSRAGLVSAMLLALSPLHVYYSREARPYALLVVLALAVFLSLEAISRRGALAPLVLALLAAAYTHYYGLFLLAVLAAARVPARTATSCALLFVAGYLPWLPSLWRQSQSGATAWVARLWRETPPQAALVKSLAAFAVGGHTPTYVQLEPPWMAELTPWVAYTVFGFLLVEGARRQRALAVATLLLLVVPFTISFWRPMYLVGRHDVIALPLVLVLCACGAVDLPSRWLRAVLPVLLALATLTLGPYYARAPVAGVEVQARLLVGRGGAGDWVLCTGFTRNTLEYYVRLAGGRQRFHSFPTSFGEHRGWVDERELTDPTRLRADSSSLVSELSGALATGDRLLWIAHSRLFREATDILMADIARQFRQTACPADGETYGFTCWTARPGEGRSP